jgi:hypothetical protein
VEPRLLLLLLRVLLQDPVLAAVGVLFERQLGALQVHLGQHDAACEQREYADRRLDGVGT